MWAQNQLLTWRSVARCAGCWPWLGDRGRDRSSQGALQPSVRRVPCCISTSVCRGEPGGVARSRVPLSVGVTAAPSSAAQHSHSGGGVTWSLKGSGGGQGQQELSLCTEQTARILMRGQTRPEEDLGPDGSHGNRRGLRVS